MSCKKGVVKKALFPGNGQGIFLYTVKVDKEELCKKKIIIYVTPDPQIITENQAMEVSVYDDAMSDSCKPLKNFLSLNIDATSATFNMTFENENVKDIQLKATEDVGIEADKTITYWFSYDRDGLILKYGKGHVMEETTLMTYGFLTSDKPEYKSATVPWEESKEKKVFEKNIKEKYSIFFSAKQQNYVIVKPPTLSESEKKKTKNGLLSVHPTFQFRPSPLVSNFPPLVKDSSTVTLFDLDRDQYMFSSSLPAGCREMYENIKDIRLEFPENPILKLSDAIRYSIETKGKLLYEKLDAKKPPGPPTGLGSYLRVTLGPDKRTAPGIPYVFEIWPKGSKSPVHNHGGTCAIIKNLFGRLTCEVHNKLTDRPASGKKEESVRLNHFDLKQDQVTWIGPDWYQTHRLVNTTDDFCATIQSYRYDFSDTLKWSNFDFLDSNSQVQEFEPNSDFTFVYLRRTVLDEYREYLESPHPGGKRGY